MDQPRTVKELKQTALIYWPCTIVEKEKDSSIIPLLLQTQDSFISVLRLADVAHNAWVEAIRLNSDLYPNLFLKHLCVISDVGGESLKRYATELSDMFRQSPLVFEFNGERIEVGISSLFHGKKWSNTSLGLDGKSLFNKEPMRADILQVSFLLLFGSTALEPELPLEVRDKCVLGSLLGRKDELEKYIRQRYIWVSRQTGGAKSNSLGYLIQEYLLDILKTELPGWDFSRKSIDNVYERTMEGEPKRMKFDIVAQAHSGLCWAIESSFQFTTNSVIERKAGQAPSRKMILNQKGHKIAYAMDGAGNFERSAALQSIIESSDCTINLSKNDIVRLAHTMKESIR